MPGQRGPFVIRRRLGRRLRGFREQAGLTLAVAAPKLDKSISALQRIESGETRADVHLVRSILDLYGLRDDEVVELARQATKPVWWRHYQLPNADYVDLEAEASDVYAFGALSIPDLLRTDAYADAVHHARSRAAVRSHLAARAIRRQRLTSEENTLRLHVILDEAALTRVIGSPAITVEQARHLAGLSERGEVSIQILPFDAGAHEAMHGSFTVLTFPDPEDPDTLYIEHITGALPIERHDDVHAALTSFQRLRTRATSPADSLTLLHHLAGEPARTR